MGKSVDILAQPLSTAFHTGLSQTCHNQFRHRVQWARFWCTQKQIDGV